MLMLMVTTEVMGTVRDHRKAAKSVASLHPASATKKPIIKEPINNNRPKAENCKSRHHQYPSLNPIRAVLTKLLIKGRLKLKQSSKTKKAPLLSFKNL